MTDPIERFSVDSLLDPRQAARVMQPSLQSVDVHWHDYYELCLVLSGEAEHVVNGERRGIGPGSAFLLSPADFHAIEATGDKPVHCYNTVIDSGVMERQLSALRLPGADGFPWHAENFLDAEADLRRLKVELQDPRLGSGTIVEALVACLVVELARSSGRGEIAGAARDRAGRGGATSDELLHEAVLYVDRHFREPMSLAEVAARTHLSANYFSERFGQTTGSSFQGYLQDRRLRFARALLLSTSLSVTQVCHAAGFRSLSHFGRAFRRRYGGPPSAQRRDT
jgi:AraC-like DNA-binding protein